MRWLLQVVAIAFGTAVAAQETSSFLPAELGGFSACGAAETFAGKKLFDYMNGGAELYLAYGFSDIAVRSYQKQGRKLTAEVYRMGSELDAFGIFSHSAKGEAPEIGARAALSRGLLVFHKGRYLVRLVAAAEPQLSAEELQKAALQLCGKIPGESRLPPEASLLPAGAVAGSLRYLSAPDAARTVWLGGEGEAVLAGGGRAFSALYPDRDGEAQAVRATYSDQQAALRACRALAEKLELKPLVEENECRASGATPDESYAIVAAREGVLRWAGALSPESAKALFEKIK